MAEADLGKSDRIKNAEELCRLIPGTKMSYVKWTMMIASLGMVYASSISNLCMMGDTIEAHFQVPSYAVKLFTFAVITLFLIIIIEPERIEGVTYFTIICLSFLGTNRHL